MTTVITRTTRGGNTVFSGNTRPYPMQQRPLPDGSDPAKLKSGKIFPILQAAGVPGIDTYMGKQALLDAYNAHLDKMEEERRATEWKRYWDGRNAR